MRDMCRTTHNEPWFIYWITVECTCGEKFETRSTYAKGSELKVAVCSKCHPFYTGKAKFIDAAGRVDKFNKKYSINK